MITEVRVKRFKKIAEATYKFRPVGVTLLAGDNNSGKSSLLHSAVVWHFLVQQFGRAALNAGAAPAAIRFTPVTFGAIAMPTLDFLWLEAKTTGRIELECRWGNSRPSKRVRFALKSVAPNVEATVLESTLSPEDSLPEVEFLPSLSAVQARETYVPPLDQDAAVATGNTGSVIRSILADMHGEHSLGIAGLTGLARANFLRASPWERLQDILQKVFDVTLIVKPPVAGVLQVLVQEVILGPGGDRVKVTKRKPRDIALEGSGFLQWLSVYALAAKAGFTTLLLDEPDAHLHAQLQDELFDRMKELAGQTVQLILATHSTELLADAECTDIYSLEKGRHGYVTDDDHRGRLFLGLGGYYAPKIQGLKRSAKIMFVEGPSDEAMLRTLARTLGITWNSDVTFWPYKNNSPSQGGYSRGQIFKQLRSEFPALRGLSLEDRDDKEYWRNVPANLKRSRPLEHLEMRIWRRRNFENYLLHPAAIARATGRTEAAIAAFLQSKHGLTIVGNFCDHDCYPSLALIDGKDIITKRDKALHNDSVEETYGVTSEQIAAAMLPTEVPADVKALLDEMARFFA